MLGALRRQRGGALDARPDQRMELSHAIQTSVHAARHWLGLPFLPVRVRQVRRTYIVHALPIAQIIANQVLIERLVAQRDSKVSDGVIAAVITGDATAVSLPRIVTDRLWEMYAELNMLPKVPAAAEPAAQGPASPSSTSAESSSAGPTDSTQNGSYG
jgi:hypothetical protein